MVYTVIKENLKIGQYIDVISQVSINLLIEDNEHIEHVKHLER